MEKFKKLPWRNIISFTVLLLFVLLIIRNWESFVQSIRAIQQANHEWLAVAIFGMVLTYFAAAGGYIVVSIKKLNKFRTVLAQVAAAFANKLLPSGVGGLGLNVAYLHKNKYTPTEATTVTAINSIAAFVSFSLLFIAAVLAGGLEESSFKLPAIPAWAVAVAVGALIVVAIFITKSQKIKTKIKKLTNQVVNTVLAYKDQPLRLVGAVVMATLVTAFYLVALYASAKAMGIDIGFAEIFFVYVLGAIATAAVPTPGGLGAAEAALYAGFVSYGVDESTALSAVLAYRFVTYWLPILPGYLSFQYLQRNKYI
jgi:glycosyltransferase 2 family protein